MPYPHAVDDHQTRNAQFLSGAAAAVLLPQSQLTADTLAAQLEALHADRNQLGNMAVAARAQFQPDAAKHLADALMEVAC